MNKGAIGLVFWLALFLLGADGGDRVRGGTEQLRAQRNSLRERVETLKDEQDLLLFQQEMYAADSKYLVLDINAMSGRLMYRNRVLKDFRFRPTSSAPAAMPGRGRLVLTRKTGGKKKPYALIFGNALVVQWKRTGVPPREAGIPVISVTRREMKSLFYAVEPGALAYVLR